MSASVLESPPLEPSVLPPLTPARYDPTHAFARPPASILRRAGRKSNDTVGSSVRFGKRHYDNGEESSMSMTSVSNISIDARLASPTVRSGHSEPLDDSFLRPGRRVSAAASPESVLAYEDDGSLLLEGSIGGSVERALTPATWRNKRDSLLPPAGDDDSLSFNTLLREGANLQSGYAAEQRTEHSHTLRPSTSEKSEPTPSAQTARTSNPEHDPYSPFNANDSSLFSSPPRHVAAPSDPSKIPLPDSSSSFSRRSLSRSLSRSPGESNSTLHPHEASLAARVPLPASPVPRVTVSGPGDLVGSPSDPAAGKVPFTSSPLRTPTPTTTTRERQAPAPLTPGSFVSASGMYSSPSSGFASASGLYPSSLRTSTSRNGDETGSTRWSDALDAEALHHILDVARDLDRAQTARAERYREQLSLAQASVGALQTSLSQTEQEAEEERHVLLRRAEVAEEQLRDLSRQGMMYPEVSAQVKRLTLSVREAQEAHLAEKARFQAQLQAEVQRGDELAQALASAEHDAELRVQKAREDALQEAREDTRSLLEAQVRAAEERTRQTCERDWMVRSPATSEVQDRAAKAEAEREQLQLELETERQARQELQARCDEMEARLAELGSDSRAAEVEEQVLELQAELDRVEAEHDEERRKLLDEQRESEEAYQNDLLLAERARDEKAALLSEEKAFSRQLEQDLEQAQQELTQVYHELDEAQKALQQPRISPDVEEKLARLARLERWSADKELVFVGMQKQHAALERENFKLGIALEAKQAEVEQLKRTQGVRYQFAPGPSPAGMTTMRRMLQRTEPELESESEPSELDVHLPAVPQEREKNVGLPRSLPVASTMDKENLETPVPKAGRRRLLRPLR